MYIYTLSIYIYIYIYEFICIEIQNCTISSDCKLDFSIPRNSACTETFLDMGKHAIGILDFRNFGFRVPGVGFNYSPP